MSVEIAASSAAIDTGSKKQVYRRNGVLEYVIWQSYENQIEWFCLIDGDYRLLSPSADGIIRSQVFPGLWLAVEALLNNQMVQVLEVAKRNELHTFAVIPQRWVVERSFAWLEKCRRLWKNCERKLNTSLQLVVLAFLALIMKRS